MGAQQIALCALAAMLIAAMPVRAQESRDETLKNTLGPVTINMGLGVRQDEMMRLGIVRNPIPILVKAVLAAVTAPAKP
jgi:hypothetical protein